MHTKGGHGRMQYVPVWTQAIANEKAKLMAAEAARLGRTALVIGGTGFLGRHLCNALLTRSASVFSLSRRGSRLDEIPELRLGLLDLVQWIEGDAAREELWTTLAPVVRELSEAFICLPRDEAGAELAAECIRQLARHGAALRRVVLVSRAPFWGGRAQERINAAWLAAEDELRRLFPDEHLVLQPGDVYSESQTEGLGRRKGKIWGRLLRPLYCLFLRDEMGVGQYQNVLSHLHLSLTCMKDTPRSGRVVPPMHIADVCYAALAPEIPDLDGGRVQTFTPYAIMGLPHWNPSRMPLRTDPLPLRVIVRDSG